MVGFSGNIAWRGGDDRAEGGDEGTDGAGEVADADDVGARGFRGCAPRACALGIESLDCDSRAVGAAAAGLSMVGAVLVIDAAADGAAGGIAAGSLAPALDPSVEGVVPAAGDVAGASDVGSTSVVGIGDSVAPPCERDHIQ